jgi:tight adherence protein C
MTPALIGVLAGAAVLTALWPGPKPGSPTPLTRLYARLGAIPRPRRQTLDKPPWVRKMPVQPFVTVLRSVMPGRYRDNVQRLLRISRLAHTYEDILAMKISYVLLGWFYIGLILLKKPDPVLGVLLGVMAIPAFLYPDMWLKGKAQRRQEQVRRELPAILSAVAVALEAGLHLMGAIAEVVRDRPGVLAEELRRAVEQTERGVPMVEALEALTRELEVSELTMVMAGLLQAFAKGSGHVVKTVRTQAAEAWQVRKRRAESLAQTASVKLFLPIALLALPGFMIFLLGPAVLEVVGYFIK